MSLKKNIITGSTLCFKKGNTEENAKYLALGDNRLLKEILYRNVKEEN